MRVVINKCYGGFSISKEAAAACTCGHESNDGFNYGHIDSEKRSCPELLRVIDEMGIEAARGRMAKLKVVEVPDDVKWHIEEYDGLEWVAEEHRTWD